jgi:spermidine synthase
MSKKPSISEQYIKEEGMADLWNVWYSELHNYTSGLTLKVNRTVESLQSEYQRIDVIENDDFGKLLVLYGSLMVCDNDNNAYNEMITHVPLFCHPAPKQVLIIGGGDCGALTEVLKHPEVERCAMCEIDAKVVDTARKHFPRLTAGLDDPRANLVLGDGKEFIEHSQERFDLIILDLSDPIGPAADLFQKEFHQKIHDRLTENGIMVAQSESPYYNKDTVASMYRNLGDIFPIVRMYTCFMPIYPSGYWSFAFCSRGLDPIEDFDRDRYNKQSLKTQYYNAETHCGSFALPQFVKKVIE